MAETSGSVSTTVPSRSVHVRVSQPYGLAEDDLNMPVTVSALPVSVVSRLAAVSRPRRRPGVVHVRSKRAVITSVIVRDTKRLQMNSWISAPLCASKSSRCDKHTHSAISRRR
jgi:hypothetical protein